MLTTWTYRYFQSVIPPHICQDIINYGLSNQIITGSVGEKTADERPKDELINLQKNLRNSNIAWINGEWIYRWIRPHVIKANEEAGWLYDINEVENFQFTIYKENQFYGWHPDYHPRDDAQNRVRKVSLTVSLSDPKDYEGGELEFIVEDTPDKRHSLICKEVSPRGSIVVFPSFVIHRVNPVTKGTRYSLVIWHRGPKWK